jgi:hypothetical protein
MINWPDSLVKDIALRKCVLVLGAGISMNSQNVAGLRPKSWLAFLNHAVTLVGDIKYQRSINKLIKNNDYLTACELIKQQLGRANFVDLLQNEFHTPGFIPSEVHKTIFTLDARIVITPNFDNIYDRFALQETAGTVIIKKFYEPDVAETIRLNRRLIIKNHGSIEDPNHLIFSRKDYSKARTENRAFYEILDSLSITNTFLFLGCGTNDPDIRLLLEDYQNRFQYSREHFFVLSKNSNPLGVNQILEDTMNIKILEYDRRDNHQELIDSLQDLVTKVELKREEIAATQNW